MMFLTGGSMGWARCITVPAGVVTLASSVTSAWRVDLIELAGGGEIEHIHAREQVYPDSGYPGRSASWPCILKCLDPPIIRNDDPVVIIMLLLVVWVHQVLGALACYQITSCYQAAGL